METFETFGKWLRHLRKRLDLTQEKLGSLAGCSGAAIRKFEADERRPSRELAALLANALQILPAERSLFLQMARGVYTSSQPQAVSVAETPARPAENLPTPLTSLVDRIHDVQAVSAQVSAPAARWVTLLGPPGIGKTRLSIQTGWQVLAQFADGVWFVDLAALAQAGHILPAIARALAVFGLPPSPSLDVLSYVLKHKKLLLILDNFEHIPGAALEVAELLKRCPGLKVLATSRIPLHIYGEYEYRVPPLSIPPSEAGRRPEDLLQYESVQLFIARARQHQPEFAITVENAPVVAGICAALDGLPLALELAAASLKRLTLAEMNDALHNLHGESWIRLFSLPARDLPARQHTLENVVAWSFTLLTEAQKELFITLGLFSAWFDLDTVVAVCFEDQPPPREAIRTLLDGLSDHSLLLYDHFGGVACWRMLEVIREFAGLQLDPARRARLASRLAHYLQERIQVVNRETATQQQVFFQTQGGNIPAALKWMIDSHETAAGFEMVIRLDEYWERQGYLLEGLDLFRQLLGLPDPAPPALRIGCLQKASDLAWQMHDFESSLGFTRAAAELARLHGLQAPLLWHLNRLGRIYLEQGRYVEAREVLTNCIELARTSASALNIGIPLAQLGEVDLFENRLTDARDHLQEALTHLVESEHIFQAIVTVDMAEICLAEGDYSQARAWLERAIPHASLLIRRTLVFLCAAGGYLVCAQPGYEPALRAARVYGTVQSLTEQTGIPLGAFYRDLNERRIQAIQQRLSAADWQREFNAGRLLTREAAMREAEASLQNSDGT